MRLVRFFLAILLGFFLSSPVGFSTRNSKELQPKNYFIYLSGKVRKGKEKEAMKDWREFYVRNLKRKDVKFFTPEDRYNLIGKVEGLERALKVVGKDCKIIKESDAILVDGTRKLGVGTAQEIMIAKYFNKPVFIVLPPDSAHRKKNFAIAVDDHEIRDWVQDFLRVSVDRIFDSHKQALEYIENIETMLLTQIPKNLAIIDYAIKIFEDMGKDVKESYILH